MPVTLKDIAEKAGVSISTVSRVINDDKDRSASEDTKKLIWKLVAEMGYTRKKRSSSSRGTTKKIGFIMNSSPVLLEHPFTSEIVEAIEDELATKGYSIEFLFTKKDLSNRSKLHSLLNEKDAEGIIILGEYMNQNIIKELSDSFKNIVFIKNIYNECIGDIIYIEKRKAVYEAVNYLIKLGHKEIGFLGGILPGEIFKTIEDGEKYKGYEKALLENNLTIDRDIIKDARWTLDGGYAAMNEILNLKNKPTAVFTASDLIGIGAMRAINETGLKIPEDISIISYDNIKISEYTNPPLTTIDVPKSEMGLIAVNTLYQRIQGKNNLPLKIALPTRLIIRQSVAEITKNN